jgi:hypothetical protein
MEMQHWVIGMTDKGILDTRVCGQGGALQRAAALQSLQWEKSSHCMFPNSLITHAKSFASNLCNLCWATCNWMCSAKGIILDIRSCCGYLSTKSAWVSAVHCIPCPCFDVLSWETCHPSGYQTWESSHWVKSTSLILHGKFCLRLGLNLRSTLLSGI